MKKTLSRIGFSFLVLVFPLSFSFSSSNNQFSFSSYLHKLSPSVQPINVNVILGVIAVIAILIGVGIALRLRKHLKIVGGIILAVIIVIAGVGVEWYSEASINYWLVSAYTTNAKDNPVAVYCENTGHLSGTFDLVLSFTNAHFSQKTSLPYQLINDYTVKFTFTLQPGEKQSRQAWFIIDQNVSDFYLYLSFEQNNGNFLVKSGSGGVNSISYQKDTGDANYTIRTVAPPP
jgi:hypothetical protein